MHIVCPKNVLVHLYNRAIDHWDAVEQWQQKQYGVDYYTRSVHHLAKAECLVEEIEHIVAFSIGGGVPTFDRFNNTLKSRLDSIKNYLEL